MSKADKGGRVYKGVGWDTFQTLGAVMGKAWVLWTHGGPGGTQRPCHGESRGQGWKSHLKKQRLATWDGKGVGTAQWSVWSTKSHSEGWSSRWGGRGAERGDGHFGWGVAGLGGHAKEFRLQRGEETWVGPLSYISIVEVHVFMLWCLCPFCLTAQGKWGSALCLWSWKQASNCTFWIEVFWPTFI